MPERYEQQMLDLPIRPRREVSWFNVHVMERRKLFGKKIVTECIPVSRTVIDVDTISELNDPDLRYALRFADAVAAVGWVEYDTGMSYADMVNIDATDEGANSRLVNAVYSGKVDADGHDTFMDGILRAAPAYDENH